MMCVLFCVFVCMCAFVLCSNDDDGNNHKYHK
jgi:hypothetical protein